MKVKIRHELESRALDFGEIATTDEALCDVLLMVKAWGIRFEGDSYSTPDLSGEFVITPAEAYFEILVHAEEED